MKYKRKHQDSRSRQITMVMLVLVVCVLFIVRLFSLQVLDDTYKDSAESNAFLRKTIYPSRGLIYDRNGKLMVSNQPVYDVMVVLREMANFDTLSFCQVMGITKMDFEERMADIKNRRKNPGYSRYTPQVFIPQISYQDYGLLQEKLFRFPGIFVQQRVARQYTLPCAALQIGSLGEVTQKQLEADAYYKRGDHKGQSGIENQYEEALRGQKGVEILLRDVHGRIKGKYNDGANDVAAVPGKNLTLGIDMELQAYGEKLMQGKMGSIVAIEPKSGQILAMISAPSFDPNLLVGRERSKNYAALSTDPTKPLFNRPVMAQYPPGSTFKLVQALIMQQEGIFTRNTLLPCYDGYYYTRTKKVGCHHHKSPIDLPTSIETSCNAYYCYGMRRMLDERLDKYGTIQGAYNVWRDYVFGMGFGDALGIDYPGEKDGVVYRSSTYDKIYGKRGWKSSTIISISIGQGELLATPLQIANLAAFIANKGYYKIPHLVTMVGNDSIDIAYRTPHKVEIKDKYFDVVIEGMARAVKKGTARFGQIPGIEFCGKTGTAQNPHGDDHSIFMGFAPMDNPQIAISVYVENSGFGATWAVPIASLMIEKYLHRSIDPSRLEIEKRMLEKSFY